MKNNPLQLDSDATQAAASSPDPARPVRGLACPNCGCQHLLVVYTRSRAGCILRVRECRHCGRRLTTRERIQQHN